MDSANMPSVPEVLPHSDIALNIIMTAAIEITEAVPPLKERSRMGRYVLIAANASKLNDDQVTAFEAQFPGMINAVETTIRNAPKRRLLRK